MSNPLAKMRLAVPVLIAGAVLVSGCQDHSTSAVEPTLGTSDAKGNSEPREVFTFHFPLPDQGSAAIVGDGRVVDGGFTAYTTGQCGVAAQFFAGNPILHTETDKISRSEYTSCQGGEPRVFEVHFPQASPVPLPWDGQAVDARWFELRNADWAGGPVRSLPRDDTVEMALWIYFVPQGRRGKGGGFGEACPGLLRFDEDYGAATGVQVTRRAQQSQGDAYDEWEINAGPDAVAACLDQPTGNVFPVLGYYHLPFQVNVVCRTEDGLDC